MERYRAKRCSTGRSRWKNSLPKPVTKNPRSWAIFANVSSQLDEAEGQLFLRIARADAFRVVPAGEQTPHPNASVGTTGRIPKRIHTIELVATQDIEVAARARIVESRGVLAGVLALVRGFVAPRNGHSITTGYSAGPCVAVRPGDGSSCRGPAGVLSILQSRSVSASHATRSPSAAASSRPPNHRPHRASLFVCSERSCFHNKTVMSSRLEKRRVHAFEIKILPPRGQRH